MDWESSCVYVPISHRALFHPFTTYVNTHTNTNIHIHKETETHMCICIHRHIHTEIPNTYIHMYTFTYTYNIISTSTVLKSFISQSGKMGSLTQNAFSNLVPFYRNKYSCQKSTL